jgi:hypothetical protein
MYTIHSVADNLIAKLGYKRISSVKFDETKLDNINTFINAYELLDIGDNYTLEITQADGNFKNKNNKSFINMYDIKTSHHLVTEILQHYSFRKDHPYVIRKITSIISILPIFTIELRWGMITRDNGNFQIGFEEYMSDTTAYNQYGKYDDFQNKNNNPNHMLIIRKVIKNEKQPVNPPPYEQQGAASSSSSSSSADHL